VATNACNEILKKGYLNNVNMLLQIKEGKANSQAMEWHQRLGHMLLSRMKEYATMGIIKGFDTHSFDQTINSLQCTSCILSNLKAMKFPKGQANRTTRAYPLSLPLITTEDTNNTPDLMNHTIIDEECPSLSLPPITTEDPKAKFHSIVGKLFYIANHSRPDLCQSVGVLCSYVTNPDDTHWIALKKVMRYCKDTLDHGIILGGNNSIPVLVGYSDSDWAGCIETRRSRKGYTFHVGLGCVSHQSKKQPTVELSTCEAEYVALTSAVKEMQWLRLLLSELGFEQQATKMYQDNTASIQLAYGKGH
jgi:hypothetical protein